MPNKMNDLTSALRALGFDVRSIGDSLFVEGWGIHCLLTGTIQVRLVSDPHERFGLGNINTPTDDLAEKFAEIVALW